MSVESFAFLFREFFGERRSVSANIQPEMREAVLDHGHFPRPGFRRRIRPAKISGGPTILPEKPTRPRCPGWDGAPAAPPWCYSTSRLRAPQPGAALARRRQFGGLAQRHAIPGDRAARRAGARAWRGAQVHQRLRVGLDPLAPAAVSARAPMRLFSSIPKQRASTRLRCRQDRGVAGGEHGDGRGRRRRRQEFLDFLAEAEACAAMIFAATYLRPRSNSQL
jgi:hypothetical protein